MFLNYESVFSINNFVHSNIGTVSLNVIHKKVSYMDPVSKHIDFFFFVNRSKITRSTTAYTTELNLKSHFRRKIYMYLFSLCFL